MEFKGRGNQVNTASKFLLISFFLARRLEDSLKRVMWFILDFVDLVISKLFDLVTMLLLLGFLF